MVPCMEKIFSSWIGHAITIVSTIATLGVAYGAMNTRLDDVERRIEVLETDVLKEVRAIKQEVSDLRVRMAEMGQDIRWIKESSSK